MIAPAFDPARPVLGIIAGGGGVPALVAAAATAAGRPVCILAIKGEADASVERFPHHWLHWGEIGRLFDLLSRERVGKVTDVVQVGDTVKVKLVGIDERGKIKLSMKALDQAAGQDAANKDKAGEAKAAP